MNFLKLFKKKSKDEFVDSFFENDLDTDIHEHDDDVITTFTCKDNNVTYKLPCEITINYPNGRSIEYSEYLRQFIEQLAAHYGWTKDEDIESVCNGEFKILFGIQYVGSYKIENINFFVPFNSDAVVTEDVIMSIAEAYHWEIVSEETEMKNE